jgi:hypothetical protein
MRTPIMLLQAHERTHAHALSMHARGQMVAWRTVMQLTHVDSTGLRLGSTGLAEQVRAGADRSRRCDCER